jgi:hypothetical protein
LLVESARHDEQMMVHHLELIEETHMACGEIDYEEVVVIRKKGINAALGRGALLRFVRFALRVGQDAHDETDPALFQVFGFGPQRNEGAAAKRMTGSLNNLGPQRSGRSICPGRTLVADRQGRHAPFSSWMCLGEPISVP